MYNKLLNYAHIIIYQFVHAFCSASPISGCGTCWHALRSGRNAVVFAVGDLLDVFACSVGPHRPKIGAQWFIGRPCTRCSWLIVERIANEYHGYNEHEDCNDDDDALKIQRGQERTGPFAAIVHCSMFNDSNPNIHCIGFLFIYNSNIKHMPYNMLNILHSLSSLLSFLLLL